MKMLPKPKKEKKKRIITFHLPNHLNDFFGPKLILGPSFVAEEGEERKIERITDRQTKRMRKRESVEGENERKKMR
jgi:hypothetical protein